MERRTQVSEAFSVKTQREDTMYMFVNWIGYSDEGKIKQSGKIFSLRERTEIKYY